MITVVFHKEPPDSDGVVRVSKWLCLNRIKHLVRSENMAYFDNFMGARTSVACAIITMLDAVDWDELKSAIELNSSHMPDAEFVLMTEGSNQDVIALKEKGISFSVQQDDEPVKIGS